MVICKDGISTAGIQVIKDGGMGCLCSSEDLIIFLIIWKTFNRRYRSMFGNRID